MSDQVTIARKAIIRRLYGYVCIQSGLCLIGGGVGLYLNAFVVHSGEYRVIGVRVALIMLSSILLWLGVAGFHALLQTRAMIQSCKPERGYISASEQLTKNRLNQWYVLDGIVGVEEGPSRLSHATVFRSFWYTQGVDFTKRKHAALYRDPKRRIYLAVTKDAAVIIKPKGALWF